jgi:pimeloyl-ACP methyl ester carboxylesterase
MLGEAQFVDIGGRTLYARVCGSGPVVVLNSGAGREGVGNWLEVEERLSELATAVTYDRAGLGQSAPAGGPPTVKDMAADLDRLLNALELRRPVVLAGHSLSCLLVQLYACERQEETTARHGSWRRSSRAPSRSGEP